MFVFFFSSRRRHTRWTGDWSSDVCSSDLRKMQMATRDRPVGGFCSGTKLMTLRGEVPVESVRAGDKALTLSGVEAPLKPVTRVRHRRIDLSRHAAPMLAAPVRVRAGAIEDGVPLRDLRVSPDHALSVEDAT